MNEITDPDATLYRTIPGAFHKLNVTDPEAFMAKSDEQYLLSTDQAALCSPKQAFDRRINPPSHVAAIRVADIDDAAASIQATTPVLDDHDDTDPQRAAHASIDYTQATKKSRRRAAAAFLAARSTPTYP